MKIIRDVVVCGALACVGGVRAVPQQAVPPPPNPADSSPTLAVTMSFVQEKLSGIGKVSFRYVSQGVPRYLEEYTTTDVVADASVCTLRSTTLGDVSSQTSSIPLRDVEKIAVAKYESVDADGTVLGTAVPRIFILRLDVPKYSVDMLTAERSNDKKHKGRETASKSNSVTYYFTDGELANRVAKAMLHAVELCSAAAPTNAKKPNEPF